MPRNLIIGSAGQLGTELSAALGRQFGHENVITADVKEGPDVVLDVLDATTLKYTLQQHRIEEVYLLAAMLSATAEKQPLAAWHLNMQGLINVLELARLGYVKKVFWPSSIAVFDRQGVSEPTTMYGISKLSGEKISLYYHQRYNVDVRSLRFPGLISHSSPPGGGTTDYAVDIFHAAVKDRYYNCFLKPGTVLPMMYMPDAVRATLELMGAPAATVKTRTAYNISAVSFAPEDIAASIKGMIPSFIMDYEPDYRQGIADNWPQRPDDSGARTDWGWKHQYGLEEIVRDMLFHLQIKAPWRYTVTA
jgi:nucleoside-diphosphate-sugar epimerase